MAKILFVLVNTIKITKVVFLFSLTSYNPSRSEGGVFEVLNLGALLYGRIGQCYWVKRFLATLLVLAESS